jgi:hypothetical protein
MSDIGVETPQSNQEEEGASKVEATDFGKGWDKSEEGKFSLGIDTPKPLEDLYKEEPKAESDSAKSLHDAPLEKSHQTNLAQRIEALEPDGKTYNPNLEQRIAKLAPDKKGEATLEADAASWQSQTMSELLGVARQRAGELTLPSETVDDLFKDKDGKDFSKEQNHAIAGFLEKYQKVSKNAPGK